jgi:hypothetical protein
MAKEHMEPTYIMSLVCNHLVIFEVEILVF